MFSQHPAWVYAAGKPIERVVDSICLMYYKYVTCLYLYYVQFVTDMFLICIYKYEPVWQCTSVLLDYMLLMVLVWYLLGDAVVGTAFSGCTVAAS